VNVQRELLVEFGNKNLNNNKNYSSRRCSQSVSDHQDGDGFEKNSSDNIEPTNYERTERIKENGKKLNINF
jgi:hypothetical protein